LIVINFLEALLVDFVDWGLYDLDNWFLSFFDNFLSNMDYLSLGGLIVMRRKSLKSVVHF